MSRIASARPSARFPSHAQHYWRDSAPPSEAEKGKLVQMPAPCSSGFTRSRPTENALFDIPMKARTSAQRVAQSLCPRLGAPGSELDPNIGGTQKPESFSRKPSLSARYEEPWTQTEGKQTEEKQKHVWPAISWGQASIYIVAWCVCVCAMLLKRNYAQTSPPGPSVSVMRSMLVCTLHTVTDLPIGTPKP